MTLDLIPRTDPHAALQARLVAAGCVVVVRERGLVQVFLGGGELGVLPWAEWERRLGEIEMRAGRRQG